MSQPASESICELARSIHNGSTSAVSIVKRCLGHIDALDPMLHSYREIWSDHATQRADEVDELRDASSEARPSRLLGIPIAVKDNICTRQGTTSAGSKMLAGYRSPFNATAIQRIEDEGGILIGKTHCDEFAMGSSTEHCAFGQTANPWDVDRVPGGSSGGSAAAVAAGQCIAALGSDTGGSIRQPAAFCGIVGLKPTYGRVSRLGLIAYGSSLDQIGPMTRCVPDAAWLLQTLAGPDPNDSTSADVGVPDYLADLDEPIRDLRIGVVKQYMSQDNHPAVNQRIAEAIDVYRSLGATIIDIDLSLTEHCISCYYIIAMAEASSNLARYDGIRYGNRAAETETASLADLFSVNRSTYLGAEVQRRIMLGTYVLSAGYSDAYYKRAMQVRRRIRQEIDAAFSQCDILLGPTAPTPAFRFGAKATPMDMYLADVYTTTANLAGHCAISIPCGLVTDEGTQLPVGLQLQAAPFDEISLLRAARMYERATDHHTRTPPMLESSLH